MHTQDISYIEHTLGISRGELAAIIGCSYSSLQRLSSGNRTDRIVGKEPEIIQILLRFSKALEHLYRDNAAMAKSWLRLHPPGALPPIKQIASLELLVCVTRELEGLAASSAKEGKQHV